MTPSITSPPAVRTKVRLGRRLALVVSARRDGVRNIPHIDPLTDAGTIAAVTPKIAILAAEAEEAARTEWRRLGESTSDDRLLIEGLTPVKAGVDAALEELSLRVQDRQSASVEAEELRRLARDSVNLERKIARARARIDEQGKSSRLRIDHIFDRANQLVVIYWHALRRHHRHRDALVDEPAPLTLPEWLDSYSVHESDGNAADPLPAKWNEGKRRAQN